MSARRMVSVYWSWSFAFVMGCGSAGLDAPGADGGGADAGSDAPPVVVPDGGGVGANNGCAGGTCLNPQCTALGTPVAPGLYPQLGFEKQPSYIPDDVIIPTLDDAPDGIDSPADPIYGGGGWTSADLDYLNGNNMHWDFFINTNNWCDVTQSAECMTTVMKILANQNAANHTIHHPHMGANLAPGPIFPQSCDGATSDDTCVSEIEGVESVINTFSGGSLPHLTRFRPPYGEPYQAQGPGLADVQTVVAKYGVVVGWNIDAQDSTYAGTSCAMTPCPTGQDIATNVLNLVGAGPGKGSWGIVLMHAPKGWTHDALPILFGPHGNDGKLQQLGFRLGTVEDVICWKFGKHSWEIVQDTNPGQTRKPN